MNITSLQDLIAKFHGNFNLQSNKPASGTDASAAQDAATPAANTELSSQDKVTLSAQALAYQKAHTLASGKFMNPNVFDDFMSALDPANDPSTDDGSAGDSTDPTSNPGISTLLDMLNAQDKGSASAQDSSGTVPPAGSAAASVLNTLNSFLG